MPTSKQRHYEEGRGRRAAPSPRIMGQRSTSSYSSRTNSFDYDEEDAYSFSDHSSYDTPVSSSKPILDLSNSSPPIFQPHYKNKTNKNNRISGSGSGGMAPRKRKFNFRRFGPHSVMRWLCLAVLVSLVMFIFLLFRVHIAGSVLQPGGLSRETPPKPPAWEEFPFLKRFYGGIRTLVPRGRNVPEYPKDEDEQNAGVVVEEERKSDKEGESKRDGGVEVGDPNTARDEKNTMSRTSSSSVFDPYPDYESTEYIETYGNKVDCYLDGDVAIPQVRRYDGVPKGFPDAVMGSNEMLGIDDDVCFERFGRLGPYGFGYGKKSGGTGAGFGGDREGIEEVWDDVPPVDFRGVKWAEAQQRCIAANQHRFPELPAPRTDPFRALPIGSLDQGERTNVTVQEDARPENVTIGSDRLPRTAVVIRTWADYRYDDETILYLRSLINELSLMSGGEYEVYFLIHVKDENLQIWSDDETHQRVLDEAVPEEFRGMGVLWSEKLMALVYPGLEESFARNLPVHGVYRSTFMPMQYFAFQHPEYDYYWNWEMDIRYTGHWYHFFDKVVSWAKKQPRKGLWERNSRFYVPSEHGSWEDFRQMVRVQTEMGTNSRNNLFSPIINNNKNNDNTDGPEMSDKPIWGPERPPAERDVLEEEGDGVPPTSYEKDKYEWGVDEDADLIVFNPLYDPEGTTWILRDDFTGYDRSAGNPSRRTAIITASRLSRKLLHTMHRETALKRHTMFSEMWPATASLHHGYKAVYVPHSVYIDRRWPTGYLASIFNAGRNGASGGARTSIFGDREHNFRGTTWFYSAGHSGVLWRRWLGSRVNNDGGEEWETTGEGRMCLPPMMLHPVKEVEMVTESADGQEREPPVTMSPND